MANTKRHPKSHNQIQGKSPWTRGESSFPEAENPLSVDYPNRGICPLLGNFSAQCAIFLAAGRLEGAIAPFAPPAWIVHLVLVIVISATLAVMPTLLADRRRRR